MRRAEEKIIREHEGRLWLALAEYDNRHAPVDGDIDSQLAWELDDKGHCEKLYQWSAAHDIMEALGIEVDYYDHWHAAAGALSSDLFLRRQAAKGITY